MLSFGIATITNIGHQVLALETTPNTVVNTLGFAPVPLKQGKWAVRTQSTYWQLQKKQENTDSYLKFAISVTLMTDELLSPLLHNFRSVHGSDRHFDSENNTKGCKPITTMNKTDFSSFNS